MEGNNVVEDLTEREMEVVMTVFRIYETGMREATIYPKVSFFLNTVDKIAEPKTIHLSRTFMLP